MDTLRIYQISDNGYYSPKSRKYSHNSADKNYFCPFCYSLQAFLYNVRHDPSYRYLLNYPAAIHAVQCPQSAAFQVYGLVTRSPHSTQKYSDSNFCWWYSF